MFKTILSTLVFISTVSAETCTTSCPDGWTGDGITCTAPGSYTGPCLSTGDFTGYSEPARKNWADGCVDEWILCGWTMAPTLAPTNNPTASPTDAPTLSPTTEYSVGYGNGETDKRAQACEALGCSARRRMFGLDEIEEEYLEIKDDLQHKYFNYLLGNVIGSTLVILCLLICVCRKNRKINRLENLLMRRNPGSIV